MPSPSMSVLNPPPGVNHDGDAHGNSDGELHAANAAGQIATFACTTARASSGPASAQYVADRPVCVTSLARFDDSCIDTSTAAPASSDDTMIIVTNIALPRCELRWVMAI